MLEVKPFFDGEVDNYFGVRLEVSLKNLLLTLGFTFRITIIGAWALFYLGAKTLSSLIACELLCKFNRLNSTL